MRHTMLCSTCGRPIFVDGETVYCKPCDHRAPLEAAILSIAVTAERRGLIFMKGSIAVDDEGQMMFETVSKRESAKKKRSRRDVAS